MQPSELIESSITTLWGLATFEVFVSPYLLVFLYYLGALGGPVAGLVALRRLLARHRERIEAARSMASEEFPSGWAQSVTRIKLLGLLAIIGFELLWRVLFELVLAYFQMRDYLSILAQQ